MIDAAKVRQLFHASKESCLANDPVLLGTVYCPYSNGICSMSQLRTKQRLSSSGLNPYSNGICSMSPGRSLEGRGQRLGLNPYSNGICSMSSN